MGSASQRGYGRDHRNKFRAAVLTRDNRSRPGCCRFAIRTRGGAPARICYELERENVARVPGRTSVYRALVRHGRIDPARRRRRRSDYKRWERGRSMELWQMNVVGGVHLAGGVEVKMVTGIDDNSRFVVCAKVVGRATAGPVCEALALAPHGVPEQIPDPNNDICGARLRRDGRRTIRAAGQ